MSASAAVYAAESIRTPRTESRLPCASFPLDVLYCPTANTDAIASFDIDGAGGTLAIVAAMARHTEGYMEDAFV